MELFEMTALSWPAAAKKEVSAVEVVTAFIADRALEPSENFAHLTPAGRCRRRSGDRKRHRGEPHPLAGVPVVIKITSLPRVCAPPAPQGCSQTISRPTMPRSGCSTGGLPMWANEPGRVCHGSSTSSYFCRRGTLGFRSRPGGQRQFGSCSGGGAGAARLGSDTAAPPQPPPCAGDRIKAHLRRVSRYGLIFASSLDTSDP